MCGMPGVEFLQHPEDDAPEPEPRHAAPRSRRDLRTKLVVAGAAVVAAAVALAVVLHSSGGSGPSAAGGHTSPDSSASKQAPKSSPKPTASPLALPATDAFGPHSSDLITLGNLVFALGPTVVGVANREGGLQVVRPAPNGLTTAGVHGVLRYDDAHRVLWVVALGGRAIGSYEPSHLASLGAFEAPGVIRDAVAMGGRLWFLTRSGLYFANPRGRITAVPRAHHRYTSIAADPLRNSVLTVGGGDGDQLYRWNRNGLVYHKGVPLLGTTVTVTDGRIWICAFHPRAATALARLDPGTFRILHVGPATFQLGRSGQVAGTYAARLLLRGDPGGHELFCVDALTGEQLQQWSVPNAAVALNERGLLIVSPRDGIQSYPADACLNGARS
jgi:hypothetical protein